MAMVLLILFYFYHLMDAKTLSITLCLLNYETLRDVHVVTFTCCQQK